MFSVTKMSDWNLEFRFSEIPVVKILSPPMIKNVFKRKPLIAPVITLSPFLHQILVLCSNTMKLLVALIKAVSPQTTEMFFFLSRWQRSTWQQRGLHQPWRKANPRMACQSVAAVMDEQALLGLNPNADARYRQRVRRPLHFSLSSTGFVGGACLITAWCVCTRVIMVLFFFSIFNSFYSYLVFQLVCLFQFSFS